VVLIRLGARASLIETQRLQLAEAFDGFQQAIDRLAADAIDLARETSVRAFARDTLVSGTVTLEQSQVAMVGDFARLLEENADSFVAIRYVTFNGAVWTEATLNADGIVEIDRSLRLGELANDALIAAAADLSPNNALAEGITFRRSPPRSRPTAIFSPARA
jgi:hypothetical protein